MNKIINKKVLRVIKIGILCICIIAFAAACEKENKSRNKTETQKEKTVITMMYSGNISDNDFETERLPKLVSKYYPDIELRVTKLPDEQYYTSLKTKLASGECTDMIFVQAMYAGENAVYSLAKAGYLEPLNDLECIKKSGTCAQYFTMDDNVYAVSSGVSLLGTYYNKEIFKELGLKEPTNWEEFNSCCKTIKRAGITPIIMGDKSQYTLQFGLYQIAVNQIYPNNPDFDNQLRSGKTKFTDAGTWDKVLDMYKSLYAKGYMEYNSLQYSEQQAISKFKNGDAAMIFGGSFNITDIVNKDEKDKYGFFPLPGNNKGDKLYAAIAAGGGPAIYSGSKHKDICKKILQLMHDGESEIWKQLVSGDTYIPIYGYEKDNVNELYKPFLALYEKGQSFYWCNQGWPSGTENTMENLFYNMMGDGKTTIPDITKGMQKKFEELNK